MKGADMVGKNIESVLLEERLFPPPRPFTAKARLKPADVEALYEAAAADPVEFWADLARKERREKLIVDQNHSPPILKPPVARSVSPWST